MFGIQQLVDRDLTIPCRHSVLSCGHGLPSNQLANACAPMKYGAKAGVCNET